MINNCNQPYFKKKGMIIKMNNDQRINCTVKSCKYNNHANEICELNSIIVTPKKNVNSGKSDESKCSSYENE